MRLACELTLVNDDEEKDKPSLQEMRNIVIRFSWLATLFHF
jgi:hypothetical protein